MKRNEKGPERALKWCSCELMGRMSMIEIHSNSELIVSGCVSICDYSESLVVIETVSGRISVFGECFCINVFRGDILSISGRIKSVALGEAEC